VSEPTTAVDLGNLIGEIRAEVEAGPTIYRPSRFWETWADVNSAQIAEAGFENFKRTVNQNYFNWVIANPRDPQVRALVQHWLRRPTPAPFFAQLVDPKGVEAGEDRQEALLRTRGRFGYAVFVALLWDYARGKDHLGLLPGLSEPTLGNPILVRHRGRTISQDLANSALEFYSVTEAFRGGIPNGAVVVELGGGYGRLGWFLASVIPGLRYIAVDIPPALAIAQEYLTRLFPTETILPFRRGAVDTDALDRSRLAFITPNQLELLPSIGADLFLNVSSLHEMRPDQIARYLELADRHTRGVFYSKQWIESVNPHDGVVVRQADYPVPANWHRVFERKHPIQVGFFEAAFETRPGGRAEPPVAE
jgi:putative sugar O-methyltransferase